MEGKRLPDLRNIGILKSIAKFCKSNIDTIRKLIEADKENTERNKALRIINDSEITLLELTERGLEDGVKEKILDELKKRGKKNGS